MKEQFIPYDQALVLKRLGFDEKCFALYNPILHLDSYSKNSNIDLITDNKEVVCSAPLWQQAFDWMGNNHFIYAYIRKCVIGSDEWEYSYEIDYLPKEFWEYKRRASHFVYIESISFGSATYSGAWATRYEAQQNCLEKLIELCKKR